MTDLIPTILNLYQAFHEGRNIQEVTNNLLNIYCNPSSLQSITTIITTSTQPYIQQQGVVGVGILIKKCYPKLSLQDQANVFTTILNLLIFPNSAYVRRYIKDFVQTCLNADLLPIAQEFITKCQQDISNGLGLEASLYLLTMLITYQEDSASLLPISIPMIEAGLANSSNDVQLAAVLHGLNITNLLPQDSESMNLFGKYLNCAITLLTTYVTSNNPSFESSLSDLVKGIVFVTDQGIDGIDFSQILQTCLSLLRNYNIAYNFRSQVQIVTDIIISNSVEEIAQNPDVLTMIFQSYFEFAQSIFNESEDFDFSGHNVFSTICVEFSEYPDVLQLLWNITSQVSSTPHGRFASIVALFYSLSEGKDFFASKINHLADLFISGLMDSAECTNEASALAISELALTQKAQLKAVSDKLIQAILQKLSQQQISEYVQCLNHIVSAQEIGPIFEQVFHALCQLLQLNNITLNHSIFDCLYSLVRYSPKRARHFFKDIFGITQRILNSTGEIADQLKGKAISILSYLLESNNKLFAPFVPQFLQMAVQNLNSSDPQILYESVTAYGKLLQNFSEEVKASVSIAFPKLVEIASKDIVQPDQSEEGIFAGDDEDDVDIDSKIEPIINVVISAIRVSSCTLSTFPELIPQNVQSVLNTIQTQLNVGDSDCCLGCAQGCVFLVEGFVNLGFNNETIPLLKYLVKLLTSIVGSECSGPDAAGSAFTAISDVIAGHETIGILCCYDSLKDILIAVKSVFEGKMLYQAGKLKYIEELHVPALRVIREIIAAMKIQSIAVIQELGLVDLFNNLFNHKSNQMRDLALQFYGDLIYWASEGLDDELKNNAFIVALDATATRNSAIGFGVFKQLAMKAPHIIQTQLNQVLTLIKAQLCSNEPVTETLQSVQDNAVSALGMIAMKIMGDSFPLSAFTVPALAKMPAQLEAEENNDHIEFFFWLLQKANGQHLPQFAAVAIRLFSDPLDKLEEYCVSQENIKRMQQVLKKFASSIPNFQVLCQQVCEDDEYKIDYVVEALNS